MLYSLTQAPSKRLFRGALKLYNFLKDKYLTLLKIIIIIIILNGYLSFGPRLHAQCRFIQISGDLKIIWHQFSRLWVLQIIKPEESEKTLKKSEPDTKIEYTIYLKDYKR